MLKRFLRTKIETAVSYGYAMMAILGFSCVLFIAFVIN
jgi:hypothetical protein